MVIQGRVANLGRQRIVGRIVAGRCSGLRVARGGVARLDHETADDAMEKIAVVIAFPDQFEEIVTMEGRLVVQDDADIAHRRLQDHFMAQGVEHLRHAVERRQQRCQK